MKRKSTESLGKNKFHILPSMSGDLAVEDMFTPHTNTKALVKETTKVKA